METIKYKDNVYVQGERCRAGDFAISSAILNSFKYSKELGEVFLEPNEYCPGALLSRFRYLIEVPDAGWQSDAPCPRGEAARLGVNLLP